VPSIVSSLARHARDADIDRPREALLILEDSEAFELGCDKVLGEGCKSR
jgi:hypothetical protein